MIHIQFHSYAQKNNVSLHDKLHRFFVLGLWWIPVWNVGKSARYKILPSSVDITSSLWLHQLICAGKKRVLSTCTHESDQKRLILGHCLSIVVSFTSLNHTQYCTEQHVQGKELRFKIICPSADSTGKKWHLESMKLHSPSCAKE